MIRRPPRSTQSRSSAASDVYKRQDHLPIGVQESRRVGVGPGAGTIRVEQTELPGLVARDHRVLGDEPAKCLRVGEIAIASVPVVVTAHRLLGQPLRRITRVVLPNESTDKIPN